MSEKRWTSEYSISSFCPKCESVEFKRVKPKHQLAIQSDRVCKKCGTRYTPTTPTWVQPIFMVLGVVFLLGGAVGAYLMATADEPRIKGTIVFAALGLALSAACFTKAFTSK